MRPTRTLTAVASVLVLAGAAAALAGCASATGSGGRAAGHSGTVTAAAPSASAADTVAARKALATAEATRILGTFDAPADARKLSGRPAGVAVLRQATIGTTTVPTATDDVSWYRVPGTPASVLAGLRVPSGAGRGGSGSTGGAGGSAAAVAFSWPAGSVLDSRTLAVSAAKDGSDTVLRVDAVVTYLPIRPADSLIPAGVRVATISSVGGPRAGARPGGTPNGAQPPPVSTGPASAVTVTDPAVVAALANVLNTQPMQQVGVHPCPAMLGGETTVSFAARTGGPAMATVRIQPDGCGTAAVTVVGGGTAALGGGPALIARLTTLAHVRLPR